MQTSLAAKLTSTAAVMVMSCCAVVAALFYWAHANILREQSHKAILREVADYEQRLREHYQQSAAHAAEIAGATVNMGDVGFSGAEQVTWFQQFRPYFHQNAKLEQVLWINTATKLVEFELNSKKVKDIETQLEMEEGRKTRQHPAFHTHDSYPAAEDWLRPELKDGANPLMSLPKLKRGRDGKLDERRLAIIQATALRGQWQVLISYDIRPWLQETRKHFNQFGLEAYLTNAQGDYLDHPDPIYAFGLELGVKSRLQQDFLNALDFLGSKSESAVVSTGPLRDDLSLAMRRVRVDQLPDNQLLIVAMKGSSRLFKSELERYQHYALISIAVLVILTSLITYASARVMTANLGKITKATQDFAAGAGQVDIFINTRDEIGLLAKSFAHMVHEINERTKRLKRSEETSRRSKDYAEEVAKTKTLLLRNLRKQKSDLEELAKEKDDLLAIVSHDLKNPLAVIESGMDHLLSDKEEKKHLSAIAADLITRSKNNARYALNLIADLLDLARLEGGMKLIYAATDIGRMVQSCFDSVKPKLEEKKLHWKVDMPERIVTLADEARLQQVIHNIIGNAIKFTPVGGSIVAQVTQGLDPHGAPWLNIAISDTGRGIPADKIDSIFDKYQQAQAADRETGSGLGLAICKNIAVLHGGDIKVKSVVGKGSVFTISIPIRAKEAKDENALNALKNRKILVVDDSADVLAIMNTKLTQKGAKVRTANNGAKALEEIERERPDIVMLDLEMPVLGGIDTLKHIREKYDRQELPVIIFSNKAQSETIEFFQLDVNDFANKREMLGDVFDKMVKVLEAKVVPESKEARVLLVDDSEDIHALFKLFLKDQPITLDIAPTLKHAKSRLPQDGPYDLVFLDMNLPDGAGMEFVAPLRVWEKQQGIKETPIIAITGMAGGKDVDPRLLETSGIKIVISKAITKQKLLAYIQQYIDQQKLKSDV